VKKPLVTLALLAVILTLGLIACQKYASSSTSNTTSNNIPPDVIVTANLQGRVVDESGTPVEGATVKSGAASATTDVNGIFTFTNISLSSRFGYVQAFKSGYFTGSRSIVTSSGGSNYVNIRLIPQSESGSFLASTGGTVMVYAGDSVSFSDSAIVTAATNVAYTGAVHVFATYINPTNVNVLKYMPGDLRGIGADGKETALQTFGMMNVELQDDAGNKLQLASGKIATITMAIPASLQTVAPAKIPLWYFSDSTGRWMEQGAANRQGNNYIGQVSHFTFWNVDQPISTINFKLIVKDQFDNPLPHAFVDFTTPTGDYRGAYTDANGFISGPIPKGQSLVMEVVTECGNRVGGMNVGPALQDVDLKTLTVNMTTSDLTLSGKVVNCSANPVDSGMVNIIVDGLDYRAIVTKGTFTLPITRCYNTTVPIQLTPTDLTAQQTGSASTITAGNGKIDAGQLSTCQ
jgi:hypothetical protein